ncbi:hypothetical protein AX15_006517 [Amanita polypyramis BW_CC]|nr:hypothetical protein AX15_006517 [Amanita polypyramis BW_CC]
MAPYTATMTSVFLCRPAIPSLIPTSMSFACLYTTYTLLTGSSSTGRSSAARTQRKVEDALVASVGFISFGTYTTLLIRTVWLDNLRLNPKWDEALFRNAYGIPLEEDLEGVSLSPSDTAQKRRVSEDAQPGPSVSPKRARHDDNDHFSTFSLLDTRVPRIIDPSTPSRSALRDDRTSGWPMTPPSTSLARANRTLAEVPSSPSEESARRRGRRIHGPQSRCLQNFDSVMSEISSTSDGLSPRSFAQPTVADELDTMLMRLKSIPEHIRKLERLQDAKQGMIDGRNSRIHTLQTELERAMQENEKLIRENERLTRENERLSRTLSHTS